jgi:hypothetical protein
MSDHLQTSAETTAAILAKAAPPATVSLATIAGYQVSELVLWATLVYTLLLIGHKLLAIYKEFTNGDE